VHTRSALSTKQISQSRAGRALAACATVVMLFVTGCGEGSSKNQKRSPGATDRYAKNTIEQCYADKEKNESDPNCSRTTDVTANPGFSAAEKALTARPGGSATITLESKPTEGITLLQFGVKLYANDGSSPVPDFPEQYTAIRYGNARFCVFVPPGTLPGTYTAKFFAKGTAKGVENTFDQSGQVLDVPVKIEGNGSSSDSKATMASVCPNTTSSGDAAAGAAAPTTQYSPGK
jgi:hypothetical protein